MDTPADEFTADFQCALHEREQFFCCVKKQTKKQKAKQTISSSLFG